MQQQLKWNDDMTEATLITKNSNGTLTAETLSIEEATKWIAENR